MIITFSPTFLTIAGKRSGVMYATGPWVDGVDPATIKVRPRKGGRFGPEVRAAFGSAVENNSDMRTDYRESDCLRVTPGHPHYVAIATAAGRAP